MHSKKKDKSDRNNNRAIKAAESSRVVAPLAFVRLLSKSLVFDRGDSPTPCCARFS